MTEPIQAINVAKIKSLIDMGFNALPSTKKQQRAVLVIGDTGVGKSTVISALAGKKLLIKHNGLNTVIASAEEGALKIGHEKYSQTTIPTKVMIADLDFYDCSGFKDNRGDQYEISNSFFLQRLFYLYKQVKIFLIVDEHYVSEARIDKLPKLIRNLSESFGGLQSIQDGVVLLINRAKSNCDLKDYCKEIEKMSELKGEKPFFNESERAFLEFLLKNNRIAIFKQAEDKSVGKTLQVTEGAKLLAQIQATDYVKSKRIKNIISESTKLAIRDYIDELISSGDSKFQRLSKNIHQQIRSQTSKSFGSKLSEAVQTQKLTSKIIEDIKTSQGTALFETLSTNLPELVLGDVEKDFIAVIFFKEIYDKSANYFTVLKHQLVSQLTSTLLNLQKEIEILTKQEEEFNALKKKNQELQSSEKKLAAELNSIKENHKIAIKSSEELERAFKKKQAELQAKCATIETEKGQSEKKLAAELNSIKQNHQITIKSSQELEKAFKKKQAELQAKCATIETEKEKQIRELSERLAALKLDYDSKSQEIELLNMENESLKSEIDVLESRSVASIDSKASKYPEVHCPHFKNGGKCKHCIKKWKDSQ